MRTFQYTIKDEVGIHARPAGELCRLSKGFQADVKIRANEKEADAGRLMAVMALGIKKGQTVTVDIEGPDEDEAGEKIREFFEKKL